MVYSVKAVRFFVIIVCRYILDALLCRVRQVTQDDNNYSN